MIRHLPNVLTILNLVCGGIGIICVFHRPEIAPLYFILGSCLFDFLDGFTARLLRVSSPIGKELDSLADVVSFGIYPAVFTWSALEKSGAGNLAWISMGLATFSALRLAKFNVDDRQHDSFIGLPTPAMALFTASMPFAIETFGLVAMTNWLLSASVVLMCVAMVAPLPLPALKFKSIRWTGNEIKFTLILTGVGLLLTLGPGGFAPTILIYLSSSVVVKKF